MTYDPVIHARRSIRLPDYDYSQAGAYYLTICSHQRRCIFGVVRDGRVRLSRIGKILAEEWLQSCEVRPEVTLDEWTIMPNHLHAIVVIGAVPGQPVPLGLVWPAGANVGATRRVAHPKQTLGERRATHRVAPTERPTGPAPGSVAAIVGQFKGAVTRRVNALRNTPGAPVWHRNYHEHVIRDEAELHDIRLYIAQNPSQWATDAENPRYRTVMGRGAPKTGQS
jgi:REP element-mobilizing transposase RayT